MADLSKITKPVGSHDPDAYTKKCFSDGGAEGQVFHFNALGLRYGTDDKGHAAALVLSAGLIITTLIALVISAFVVYLGKEPKWFDSVITWLGNAFLFTSGIAIGKSGKAKRGLK